MASIAIEAIYFSTLGIRPEDNTPGTGVFGDPGKIENQNARIISLLLAAIILEEKALRIRRKKRV